MNKEEKSEYNKKYNEANKEILAAKRKVYKQTYNKANKEKVDTYNKAWREANKEYFKAWNEAKDGLYTVYYLKEEHYAGMTSRLYYRLAEHKSKYNRHIEDVEIIGKYKTKKEATRVEAALHAMGYLGGHPRTKQQTLKQVL